MDKFDIREYILKNRNTLFQQSAKRRRLRENEELEDEGTSDELSVNSTPAEPAEPAEPAAPQPAETRGSKTDIFNKLVGIYDDAKALGDEKFLIQVKNTITYYNDNILFGDVEA